MHDDRLLFLQNLYRRRECYTGQAHRIHECWPILGSRGLGQLGPSAVLARYMDGNRVISNEAGRCKGFFLDFSVESDTLLRRRTNCVCF